MGGLLPRGFDSLRISNAKFITARSGVKFLVAVAWTGHKWMLLYHYIPPGSQFLLGPAWKRSVTSDGVQNKNLTFLQTKSNKQATKKSTYSNVSMIFINIESTIFESRVELSTPERSVRGNGTVTWFLVRIQSFRSGLTVSVHKQATTVMIDDCFYYYWKWFGTLDWGSMCSNLLF